MTDGMVRIWSASRLHSRHGVQSARVKIDARMAGITKGQLKRARIELKVKTVHLMDRAGKPSDDYIWVLR